MFTPVGPLVLLLVLLIAAANKAEAKKPEPKKEDPDKQLAAAIKAEIASVLAAEREKQTA